MDEIFDTYKITEPLWDMFRECFGIPFSWPKALQDALWTIEHYIDVVVVAKHVGATPRVAFAFLTDDIEEIKARFVNEFSNEEKQALVEMYRIQEKRGEATLEELELLAELEAML